MANNFRILGISAAATVLLSGVITVGFAGASWLGGGTSSTQSTTTAQVEQSSQQSAPDSAPQSEPAPQTAPEPEPIEQKKVDCAVTRCIALTFDDGPDKDVTPRILDTLREKNVRATFFQLGRNMGGNEDLIKRIHKDGHVLATHTWDHPQLPLLSDAEIQSQILETKKTSESITGVKPTLMRPPYGLFNDAVVATVSASQDSLVMWDVDTEDWSNLDPQVTSDLALAGAHPGAIILMHDIHPSTADALPRIIDGLEAAGYTLVDVPTILGTPVPGEIYYTGLEPQTPQSGN